MAYIDVRQKTKTVSKYVVLMLIIACETSWAARNVLGQSITVSPPDGLADESLKVRVSGLVPNQPVIIRASTQDVQGKLWQSYAGFFADRLGNVDMSTQAPLNGTYKGIDPMGLIWSMNLPGADYKRTRFIYKRAEPLRFRFNVEVAGKTVGEMQITRRFMRAEGKMLEVRSNGLVGTLYTPTGAGPFRPIIVLGGSEGGLGSEDVAALLSSHGYAAFALAYFGMEGLPQTLEEIPLEYFKQAIDWMMALKIVRGGGVVLLGTSKGAESALLVGAHYKEVRAVVAYAPSGVVWSCICGSPNKSSWLFRGKPEPFIPQDTDPTYRPPEGFPIGPTINYLYRLRNRDAVRQATIPAEQINGPILLISGQDDQLWPSSVLSKIVIDRLKTHGHSYTDQQLDYEQAGHLIGKANLPIGTTEVAAGRLSTGGTIEGNAKAQQESWPRVLGFLETAWSPQRRTSKKIK